MNKNKNLISRRGLLQGVGATFVALEISAMTNGAFASSWPKKPITVVIMYGAGGGTDTITLGDTDAAYDIKLKNSTMTSISVDGSTGYVGINSTSPDYLLDVGGVINSSNDVKINGTSVLTSAENDAVALAIALG